MKAVVACISYGLGNQLMQFAAGYSLARRLECSLDLDIAWFDQDPGTTAARSLLVTRIVPENSFRRLLHYSRWNLFRDRIRRGFALSIRHPYRHGVPMWNPRVHQWTSVADLSTPVCIVGVPGCKDALYDRRKEIFEIVSDGLGKAASVATPTEEYAFVHVRLGDFVSSPHVKAKMVQLSRDYYKEAMRRYEAKNGKARWILLSDEPDKALEKIPREFSVELGHGQSEIDDLFLMSRSSGGVTANSTFSLWGGLLAEHNGGTVIAPTTWREDQRTAPTLPDTWMRA